MKEKTLSVAAIGSGTVIDHIPAGEGMRIVRLLQLAGHGNQVTLGLNLPSKTLGSKDLIKVEGREINEEEANRIAVFAPRATLNVIRDFNLYKKFKVELPEKIEKVLDCPNGRCITNHEEMETRFLIGRGALSCFYCEKSFKHERF